MTNVSFQLATGSIFIRTVVVDGKTQAFNVDIADLPETVLASIFQTGMKVLLTNVYNGGGKDATDSERVAALQKKVDSWKRGEFNVVERGESFFTAWREVYLADCIAAGMTSKAADANLKEKVTARFGKDMKATFSAYLDAMALDYVEAGAAPDTASARQALEGYYMAETQKREEAAAKASAKIVAPTIDLKAFMKKAK
jgi:hypothetical protein